MTKENQKDSPKLVIMVLAEPARIEGSSDPRDVDSVAASRLINRLGSDCTRVEGFERRQACCIGAARSEVFARQSREDNIIQVVAWASLERVSCLELVTADRIVAWMSARYDWSQKSLFQVSCLGSRFDNLKLRGADQQIVLREESD